MQLLLVKSGAIITVIANKVSSTFANMQNTHNLIFKEKLVEKSDLEGFRLVVSATKNSDTDRLVAKTANELDILLNVVDNPALCSFIFPAMIDRSPVITAVSSGGTSPILV